MTAPLVQHSRVIRRKLLDRASSVGGITVTGFEPPSGPPNPDVIHAAVVNGPGRTHTSESTLAGTSVWQSYIVHLFRKLPMNEGDQAEEQVDPELSDKRDTVLDALHSNISFGDGVELDVVGRGEPIRWAPGYIEFRPTKYRSETITAGFIIYNAWDQVRA